MDADAFAARLRASVGGRVTTDEPLARFTTYRLGGPAAVFVEAASVADLAALFDELGRQPPRPPVLIVGRGSNLVVSDRGWPGVAVRLAGGAFASIDPVDGGVRAGGATQLPALAIWTARAGLTGLEFTIAIPGSVGGAVHMNAGAHGADIAEVLESADLFDLDSGARSRRAKDELDLSYRHSNLRDTEVVVAANFRLARDDPADVRGRIDAYRAHRSATQPPAAQNAGSVFRNPPGDHAGRLVESVGLKGHRVGGAEVSQRHANFFIARDGATAQDVFDLVSDVRARVAEARGIELVPEIRFVGEFDGSREQM